jgi:hypothetical protein
MFGARVSDLLPNIGLRAPSQFSFTLRWIGEQQSATVPERG